MNQCPTDNHALPGNRAEHQDTRSGADNRPFGWQWEPQSERGAPHARPSGSWLIFTGSHGLGHALAAHLEAHGESCIFVSPGHCFQSLTSEQWYWLDPDDFLDFQRLFQSVQESEYRPCHGIVYLWDLDAMPPADVNTTGPEHGQATGLAALMRLIHALAHSGWRELPWVWVAMRGRKGTAPATPGVTAVARSSLWDMVRRAAHQHHVNFSGGVIDLDPVAPSREAITIFKEIWSPLGSASTLESEAAP